jgi:NAD(P)H-nitrite reductase large subunit
LADLAIVGIGVHPNVELAQSAGIVCDNGIMVDEYCRTVIPT